MLTEKPYHSTHTHPLYLSPTHQRSPPLASAASLLFRSSLPPKSPAPASCYYKLVKRKKKEEAGRVQKDKIFFAVQWMKLQGRFINYPVPLLLFSARES